jgi:serine/threonine protein kinase/tetratricopeptide (TPR) repeat protein
MIGTRLGRYEIQESIGKGGMGEVYLARDPALGREVAIKVLPEEFSRDAERRKRLLHEARAASALNHPSIVTVHDLGEAEGVLYIAMERVDGVTLKQWGREKPRSPAQILKLFRQATQALAVAHAADLVHRDIKPENLMVRRDGLIKILDFGIARSVEVGAAGEEDTATSAVTYTGSAVGTAPYMSPEQVLGKPAGTASDIFSLGVVLYELLAGRHPFRAETHIDTLHRILHETPEPPSKVNPKLSGSCDFVIGKALSKDPKRRHATARDFDVDLETLEIECRPAFEPAPQIKTAGPQTIAVLPFKNIGGNPDLAYLGVGLADAVITRLSQSPDLIVRTTGAILPYEGQTIDPRQVGQQLEATAVLDASFQKAGDRFRATARLVEATSGKHLWAGKVDLDFDDVFEVQDQVALGIAETLTARLTASEEEETKPEYVPKPKAYELVTRARSGMWTGSQEGFLGAIKDCEKAVEIDPDYAVAWAQLGNCYHAMADSGWDMDVTWYEKEEKALERASELDPDDPMVNFAVGCMHLVRGRKSESYDALVMAYRKAPHFPFTPHFLGYLFRLSNMFEEARAAYTRALELNPYVPWSSSNLIRIAALEGRDEEVESWARFLERRLGKERADVHRAVGYALQGRIEEALELISHIDLGPKVGEILPSGNVNWTLYMCQMWAGKPEQAHAGLAEVTPESTIDMDHAAVAASYQGKLGNLDMAFRFLDRAAELGNDMLTDYERSPFYEPLRSDPRWAPFIEGVRGRVEKWKQEFKWPV